MKYPLYTKQTGYSSWKTTEKRYQNGVIWAGEGGGGNCTSKKNLPWTFPHVKRPCGIAFCNVAFCPFLYNLGKA